MGATVWVPPCDAGEKCPPRYVNVPSSMLKYEPGLAGPSYQVSIISKFDPFFIERTSKGPAPSERPYFTSSSVVMPTYGLACRAKRVDSRCVARMGPFSVPTTRTRPPG